MKPYISFYLAKTLKDSDTFHTQIYKNVFENQKP